MLFLKTERLRLYHPSSKDLEEQCLLQADPKVMEWIGNGVRTKEEVKSFLDVSITHYEKHGFSLGNLYLKDGTFIGRAGIIHLEFKDELDLEVGYALLPEFWGKGYATEITRALINWAFSSLEIPRIVAVAQSDNDRSMRVMKKCGMKQDGTYLYGDKEALLYSLDNIKRTSE